MKINAYDDYEVMQAETSPPEVISDTNQITLPKFNITYIAAGIMLFIGLFFIQSLQQAQSKKLDTQEIISGIVISKSLSPAGGVKLILDNQQLQQQYTLILSPDVIRRTDYVTGNSLQVKATKVDDIYVTNNDKDITELVTIKDYLVINDVSVKHGLASFQLGQSFGSLYLGLPNGYYSQVIVSVDSNSKIEVLKVIE